MGSISFFKKHHALKYVLVEVTSELILINIAYSVLSNAHALSFSKGYDSEQLRHKYIGLFERLELMSSKMVP